MDAPIRFLTAEWRSIVMANFEVDPELVRRLVPRGVELDFWNGRTYVSLVGFMFLDTRVKGLPVPGHRDFEEVNLRFYVRRKADDGWRRGVSFVREIVPRRLVTFVANALYNEKYVTMPMRHGHGPGLVRYQWKHAGRWNGIEARYSGEPTAFVAGSEAEFIIEHYWGYTAQRDGGTVEYRVDHRPWRIWPDPAVSYSVDGAGIYGTDFGRVLECKPTSAFLAEGSPVTVYKGTRLRAGTLER